MSSSRSTQVRKGVPVAEAAIEGAKLRSASVMEPRSRFSSASPAAVSSAVRSRHSWQGVIGGMLAATFIATLFRARVLQLGCIWGRQTGSIGNPRE